MKQNLTQAVKRAGQEVRLWTYAAWTLPFLAIALIVFEHFIGVDTWISTTLVIITTIFFSISVFWWWWALNKVVTIMAAMKANEDRFQEVIHEMKQTRKVMNELLDQDVGNR